LVEERKQEGTNRTPRAADRKFEPKKRRSHGNVGEALRSIYDETVDENIPQEMLDLLGKLA